MREFVRERIRDAVHKVIDPYGKEGEGEIPLEKPHNPEFGDFSTNIAMTIARQANISPRNLGEKIASAITASDSEKVFARVEVAGPGFVNMYISHERVRKLIDTDVLSKKFFQFDSPGGPPILLEFVSANPTGPLHVGHGRGAAIGDSLARILRFTGRDVVTEYYVNDVGNQMSVLGRSLYLRYLQELGEEIEFPEDHYKGDYLRDIAKCVVEREGESFREWTEETRGHFLKIGKDAILEEIKKDLSDFNVSFDNWFSEMLLFREGEVDSSIASLKEGDCVYEDGGALWFKSTEFGDDKDRVVVRANGQNTYFTSDIAYHIHKIKRGYGILLDVWGADHHGYISRIKGAMKALGLDDGSLHILLVQFVNLIKEGKAISMSTRAGKYETLRSVVDEVGRDAARFFYLMRNASSHLDFDLDLAKKQSSENPVYYVQYVHARICSILREVEERGIDLPEELSVGTLEGEEEVNLMRKVLEFRAVVTDGARFFEPHRIPFYLIELAKLFHGYYNRQRFISDEKDLTEKRIALAVAVKLVVSKGLELIGVSSPERM